MTTKTDLSTMSKTKYLWTGRLIGKEPNWVKGFIKSGTLRFFGSGEVWITTSSEWITGKVGDTVVLNNSTLSIERQS